MRLVTFTESGAHAHRRRRRRRDRRPRRRRARAAARDDARSSPRASRRSHARATPRPRAQRRLALDAVTARARRSSARRSSSPSASTTPTTSPRRARDAEVPDRLQQAVDVRHRPGRRRSTCRASRRAVDYEGELGFVIGRRCRHVPRARAHEVIAGYLVVNDVTVRDWQLRVADQDDGQVVRHARPDRPVARHRRRDRRSARPAPAHLGERRAAPGLEHEAADLRLLRAGRAPLDRVHARARRRDLDRHAGRRRRRDEAAEVPRARATWCAIEIEGSARSRTR